MPLLDPDAPRPKREPTETQIGIAKQVFGNFSALGAIDKRPRFPEVGGIAPEVDRRDTQVGRGDVREDDSPAAADLPSVSGAASSTATSNG